VSSVSTDGPGITYEIAHTTQYDYAEAIAVSHHIARLAPRTLAHQACVAHELAIDPPPAVTRNHVDYYGNTMTFFAMQAPHRRLVIRARSTVTVKAAALPRASDTPPWEVAANRSSLPLDAQECATEQRPWGTGEVAFYVQPSFEAGRPLLESVADLTARINRDFTYDPEATTITTPLADVIRSRRGVCQDFARLEIACLRALGIPARYVSGYIETVAPPGERRLVGADASHAWLAVYCPGFGWVDVDPTNNLFTSDGHVTLAWGRDYADVSPTRGVFVGRGDHTLNVSVNIVRRAAS
jgi:transglutaminase-like putative cysteine protease